MAMWMMSTTVTMTLGSQYQHADDGDVDRWPMPHADGNNNDGHPNATHGQ